MFEISGEEVQKALSANQPTATQPEIGNESPDEEILTAEIDDLWQDHEAFASAIKQESQTLRALRAELGDRLRAIKQVLARPGRGGQWSAWLKEHGIPRATADRLVQKHEKFMNPDTNCLTDAISEPTEQDVQKLLNAVLPRLRRVLRTSASVDRFVELMKASFAGMEDSEVRASSEPELSYES